MPTTADSKPQETHIIIHEVSDNSGNSHYRTTQEKHSHMIFINSENFRYRTQKKSHTHTHAHTHTHYFFGRKRHSTPRGKNLKVLEKYPRKIVLPMKISSIFTVKIKIVLVKKMKHYARENYKVHVKISVGIRLQMYIYIYIHNIFEDSLHTECAGSI